MLYLLIDNNGVPVLVENNSVDGAKGTVLINYHSGKLDMLDLDPDNLWVEPVKGEIDPQEGYLPYEPIEEGGYCPKQAMVDMELDMDERSIRLVEEMAKRSGLSESLVVQGAILNHLMHVSKEER